MDNLTHTLIGVLVGETAARTTTPDEKGLPWQQRRNLFVTMAGIASNVPDLDFLSSVVSGDKLEYLLEHRGYTHTVIGTLAMAAVVHVGCELWCRWRTWSLSARDRVQLATLILVALLLHVTMDLTNNYGVHPFWPVYNGWMYGDTIFIWEPLLWTAAAPLIFILRTTVARTLVAALIATAIAVCFTSGLVPVAFSVFMTALATAMAVTGRRAAPRVALFAGIGVWFAVTAIFGVSRHTTEAQVRSFVAAKLPGVTVLDYVLTPMPANPVCWDVMLPLVDDEHYIVRHGVWSLLPGLMPAAQCPGRYLFRDTTSVLSSLERENAPEVFWHGAMTMPRSELAQLARSHCEVAAFMQFARVPWALQREQSQIVGDLRYDREPELGFSEIEIGGIPCPSSTPPWIPPRSDLLTSSDRQSSLAAGVGPLVETSR